MINITGLKKAVVLAGLYNACDPQKSTLNDWANSLLAQDLLPEPMTKHEAELILKTSTKFDSMRGRIFKVDLSDDDWFDEEDYDQINGPGTAQRVIDQLLEQETANKLDARVRQFKFLMDPALHLFPAYLISDLKATGFFTAPASAKYHGAFDGGLFEHSRNVTEVLIALTKDNHLLWQRPESPYIIGMFHDLCKIDLYRHPEVAPPMIVDGHEFHAVDVTKWEHNPDIPLKGHGDKSVMLLSQYLRLTFEEILCMRYHMGAFVDQKEWGDYTRAIRQCNNVLWTHHADMIASHVLE